jgi:hypothetical protein
LHRWDGDGASGTNVLLIVSLALGVAVPVIHH